jgi:hypothetical protein
MASAGIALLLVAQSGKDGMPGRLHLLGVIGNHPVERPLAVVGLLDRFDVALDREALLATLRAAELPHPCAAIRAACGVAAARRAESLSTPRSSICWTGLSRVVRASPCV